MGGYPAPRITAGPAGDAALSVDDTLVRLEGDVEVVAGTRATVDRRDGRTRDGTPVAWRQELTVARGAEVVCVGRLEQDEAGAWTLRAAPDQRLELYALDHRGAAEPTARMRLAVHGALATFGMGFFLVLLGLAMQRRIDEAAEGVEASSLAQIPARVQLAAMTPTGRHAAMRWLEDAAWNAVGREEIGRALTVGRRRGADVLTQQLRDLDRNEELLALARRRGADALTFEALNRLARFEEAAAVMPRLPEVDRGTAVEVAIAAGHWSDAATLVEAEARDRVRSPDQDALRCVAAWMRK
jgi:hypothetical protein